MKSRILRLLLLSLALVAVAYLASFTPGGIPRWSPWLLAIGTNGLIMTLMALGATRQNALPRSLLYTFVGLFLLCVACFAVALWLPSNEGAHGPLLFGLPLRTAVVLYGVGVLPMFVLPFAYAYTFHDFTLRDDDVQRVRDAAAAVRAAREHT
jgi:hypothetical protein